MDLKLRGKVALVTGASKGIGLACARQLAEEGCDLHLASRTKADLERAKESIQARHNVSVTVHPVDLSNGDAARSLAAACNDIDILVNNAGAIPAGDLQAVDEARRSGRPTLAHCIGNKGVSQKIISAPFSPFGQDTNIPSKNATCVVLPTTQPVHPDRNNGDLMRVNNLEQPFAPIYNYALITDAEEGLILTDINTMADGEFRNNFLKRAVTWNPGGVLNGARHIAVGGNYAYIATPKQLVVVDVSELPVR